MRKLTPTRTEVSDNELSELEFLKNEEIAQLREIALEDLWIFATQALFPDTSDVHYYEPLHRPVCEFMGTDIRAARRLLLMPRGHRKTYLVTIAQAVWRIVRDPNVRIILVSALDDTAQHFCQMVKRQFQYNEHFLRVFPKFRIKPNQQFGRTYDFTHPLRDHHNLIDPTFRAFYLGAPVAGRRCDILIADDPIEKKHVTTPEQADKSLKDFNDLIPVVDKTGRYNIMLVVGTRWAYNDIYGAMLGEERGDEVNPDIEIPVRFESIVRHCLEIDGEPVSDPKTEGEPILPTVWSRETLLQELAQYRVDPKRGEEDWWKQYMNVCMSPTGKKFEAEWFETWIPSLPSGIIFSAFLIDSASKDEQILMRGDYTVAHLMHFDSYGHLYLTDALRSAKLRGADLIAELISMQQRCSADTGLRVSNLVKEKVGEDTFFGWVRAEFNRARLPLTVFPVQVRGQGKKYVRIVEALQHPAEARQIHFVGSPARGTGYPAAIHRALVDEATHLGQWSHDDTVDALSLAFHPDIRVRPRSATAQPWRVQQSARLRGLGTSVGTAGDNSSPGDPPSITAYDSQAWTYRHTPVEANDGRYGHESSVTGLQVIREDSTDEQKSINPSTLDPKRMFLPKG